MVIIIFSDSLIIKKYFFDNHVRNMFKEFFTLVSYQILFRVLFLLNLKLFFELLA